MDFHGLTEEQKEQARACNTPEEMLALAKKLGVKLSDSELEAICGGGNWCFDDCPDNASPRFP